MLTKPTYKVARNKCLVITVSRDDYVGTCVDSHLWRCAYNEPSQFATIIVCLVFVWKNFDLVFWRRLIFLGTFLFS